MKKNKLPSMIIWGVFVGKEFVSAFSERETAEVIKGSIALFRTGYSMLRRIPLTKESEISIVQFTVIPGSAK